MADQEHSNGNGITVPSLEDRLAEHANGLREVAARERDELDVLEAQAKVKRDNLRRIANAIKELAPEQAPRRGGTPKGQPRQKTLDKVQTALKAAGADGMTYADLQTATGISHDSLARAIAWLREGEVVRHAGQQGNRPVFMLLPEHLEQEESVGP